MQSNKTDTSWRKFQSAYLIKQKKRSRVLRLMKTCAGVATVLLVIFGLFFFFSRHTENQVADTENPTPSNSSEMGDESPDRLSKTDLKQILSQTGLARTDKNVLFVDTPQESYKITTSIDIYLQEYLLSVIKHLGGLTRGKPQRIAFVVMEPETGKIIAMAGFDLDDPTANPCVEADYPAASIFKIITAAAAIEKLGYTPHTQLYFNGNKYTLYKRQLKDVKNKYTYKISFSRAFAESVNPVFGKIGKNYLGRNLLESYADAFGFNKEINSELSFVSGSFNANGNEYHLAELGCGFNNETTISPVFGAMMISAVINQGELMTPSIVEHVTDSDGEIIYKNKKSTYITAIKPETADTMVKLLETTISKGTARKSFRGFSRDRILSRLEIGGKTGSLYNREHTVKYDWFTGFGKEKTGDRKIAVAIVVGHRKYIGTRASTYAKLILKKYFEKFETKDATAQL